MPRKSTPKPLEPLKPLTPQDKFDSIMQYVLETISEGGEKGYLTTYGIYRHPTPMDKEQWGKFMQQIIKQSPKDLKPGIYPRTIFGRSVHYYALRKDNINRQQVIFTLANGYSDAGGAGGTYGRPLSAQPNHSHGLCQTFALMYYERASDQLVPGNYQENVRIGLNWIQEYVATNDWEFPYDKKLVSVIQLNEQGKNLRKTDEKTSLRVLLESSWPADRIFKEENVDVIRLHDLVMWLLAPERTDLLNNWAADLQ